MGPRGWWIRFVGIALMTVLVVTSAQTATPPATASVSYVVVTSAEQILGTWHVRTHYLRFDGEGTFREAVGQSALDTMPYAIHTYRFEDGEMLISTLALGGAPTTGESVGRYEVRILESGDLQIVLIEDPNGGRSGNLEWVYAPAASQGNVIVTSAEEVLGTWVSQIGVVASRFDEDGTLRSARSTNTLDSAPYAVSSYRFEGGEMLVTELAVSGFPSCGDAVGRYRVWLLENGHLQIIAIGDMCDGRASEMTREYVLTESAGYVVVTSAEQIIGTWMRPARYRRFDEDGTYRSASSANALDGAPSAINAYRFEEAVMLVTEVAVSGVPSCDDAVGHYEVRLFESGDLQIVVIKDPCHARAGSTAWVYERVE